MGKGSKVRFGLLALFAMASALFAGPRAQASSRSPFRWSVIQGLAQNATLIATGRVVGPASGSPSADEVTLPVAIDQVLIGDPALAKTTLDVSHTRADAPFDHLTTGRVLLFLDHTKQWRPAFFHHHGVIGLDGDKVRLWIEGKPEREFYSVDQVLAKIRALPPARIEWTASVPTTAKLSSRVLPVSFVATNRGTAPIQVMPPSFYFNAIFAYPLTNGVWDQKVGWWEGVEHWEFVHESLVTLAPGARRTFTVQVPLATLKMKDARQYEIDVRLEGHRMTNSATSALRTVDPTKVWFGGLRLEKTVVTVSP